MHRTVAHVVLLLHLMRCDIACCMRHVCKRSNGSHRSAGASGTSGACTTTMAFADCAAAAAFGETSFGLGLSTALRGKSSSCRLTNPSESWNAHQRKGVAYRNLRLWRSSRFNSLNEVRILFGKLRVPCAQNTINVRTCDGIKGGVCGGFSPKRSANSLAAVSNCIGTGVRVRHCGSIVRSNRYRYAALRCAKR